MAAISTRFFSVPARFNGRVVCRASAGARTIWAWRPPRAGQLPSPACLFVPFSSQAGASRLARAALILGWQSAVRTGQACAVWKSGPLATACPPWAVKVQLPAGVSAAAARSALRTAWQSAAHS